MKNINAYCLLLIKCRTFFNSQYSMFNDQFSSEENATKTQSALCFTKGLFLSDSICY
jgi:hypothetical protein